VVRVSTNIGILNLLLTLGRVPCDEVHVGRSDNMRFRGLGSISELEILVGDVIWLEWGDAGIQQVKVQVKIEGQGYHYMPWLPSRWCSELAAISPDLLQFVLNINLVCL